MRDVRWNEWVTHKMRRVRPFDAELGWRLFGCWRVVKALLFFYECQCVAAKGLCDGDEVIPSLLGVPRSSPERKRAHWPMSRPDEACAEVVQWRLSANS